VTLHLANYDTPFSLINCVINDALLNHVDNTKPKANIRINICYICDDVLIALSLSTRHDYNISPQS